jgi:uncharacterized cupredoxin-like copper-binding protein
MKKLVAASLVVILVVGAASLMAERSALANSSNPIEVDVLMKEYTVQLSRTNLPANTPIKFVIHNGGVVYHEVVLEKAGTIDQPLMINGQFAEVQQVEAGDTQSVVWTISEPGEYQLGCHIAGHFEGGMAAPFSINPGGLAGILGMPLPWLVGGSLLILFIIWVSLVFLEREIRAHQTAQ